MGSATDWHGATLSDVQNRPLNYIANIAGHAAVGCGMGAATDGSCQAGALAAGFSGAVGPAIMSATQSIADLNTRLAVGTALSGATGGAGSMLGGGKFENGAITGAFGYLFSPGGGGGGGGGEGGGLDGLADFAGKLWNLPNTAIGLAFGTVGYGAGWVDYWFGGQLAPPDILFGNNAIQFTNNPLMLSAMTFGNVITYGTGQAFQPWSPRNGGANTLGFEEMQHTFQGQALGPLYFPAHIVLGTAAYISQGGWHAPANVLETGPHAANPRAWP